MMKFTIELSNWSDDDASKLEAIARAMRSGPPAGLEIGSGDPPPITVWATDAKTKEAVDNVPLADLKSEIKVEVVETPPPTPAPAPEPPVVPKTAPAVEPEPPAPTPAAEPTTDVMEAVKRLRQLVLDVSTLVEGANTETAIKVISEATGLSNLTALKQQPMEVVQKGIDAMEAFNKAKRKRLPGLPTFC
jgi:hypothetical protein